ncbi:MAG TPA: M48 family metalloprotease [Streptomyces sp.]
MVTGTASPAGAGAADSPDPGPGAATDRWRRRLLTGPDVVPTATTLRFTSLVLAVLASTGSLYGYMALLVHPEADTRAAACMTPVQPPGIAHGTSPMTDTTVVLRCTAPYLSSITLWSLTGTLLMVVAMVLAYAVTPWCILHTVHPGPGEGSRWSPVRLWREAPRLSRRGLQLLRDDRADQAAVAARVEQLAEHIGLEARRRPRCHLNPYAEDTGARAFGYQRRTYLILHMGLLKLHRTDPAVFDGTVLHELAHFTNRDNRPTYVTYAAWRAYLVLVIVPFLAAFFAPGVFLHPADPGAYHLRARFPDAHSALSLVLLTGLVYLTRNAVLRVRETHADARAALTDEAAVLALLRHGAPQRGGRLPEAVGHHPSAARRLRDVGNSAVLYSPGAMAMFAAGMAIGLITVNLGFSGWIAFLISPSGQDTPIIEILMRLVNGTRATVLLAQVMVLGPAAAVALLLIAGMACVTMWRARLGVAHGGRPPAPWRAGLALAAGVLAALPLSVIYANAGTWGVFGDGAANTVIVVVLTSLTLAVIVIAFFQWAAEAATAWIPVSGSSLRRMIAASVVLGMLGAAPVFFTWLTVHDNVSITWVQTAPPAAFIRHWPLAEATVAQVMALNYLSALPGCAVLMAVPVLYVVAGAVRRSRTTAPAWARAALGPDALPIGRTSARARFRVPLIAGLLAAGLAVAVAFGYVTILRAVVGGPRLLANRGYDLEYLMVTTEWICVACCGAAAFVAALHATTGGRLSPALLAALTTAGLTGLVMPAPVYVALCGSGAWTCATGNPTTYGVLFGISGTTIAVQGTALGLCAVLLARTTGALLPRRPRPGAGGRDRTSTPAARTPTWRRALATLLTVLVMGSLAASTIAFSHYVLWT